MSNELLVRHKRGLPLEKYSLDLFAATFQFRYSPHIEFESWAIERKVRKLCERAYKRGGVDRLASWLGQFHAKEIEEASIPPVSIEWVDKKIGYGIFAQEPFKKWAFIGEYGGVLRNRKLFAPNVNDYCFMYPQTGLLKRLTIDSEKEGSFTRFINHSDKPNLESISIFYNGYYRIIFRAIEEIKKGAELTYDYGDIYWRHRRKLTSYDFS